MADGCGCGWVALFCTPYPDLPPPFPPFFNGAPRGGGGVGRGSGRRGA